MEGSDATTSRTQTNPSRMQRTLKEIARATGWEPGFDPSEDEIAAALVEAGLDPRITKERSRFLTLVKAAYHQDMDDGLGLLGDHATRAREELGPEASRDEVYCRALEIKDEEQWNVQPNP